MRQEIISEKQGIAIIGVFLLGSSVVTGTARAAGRDSWLATLVAMAAALPFLLVYARLCALYPGCSLFEMLEKALGKVPGRLFCLFCVLSSGLLCAAHIRIFMEFVSITALHRTPQILMGLTLALLSVWILRCGVEILGRCASVFAVVVTLSLLLTVVLLGDVMNPKNLLPVWTVPEDVLLRDSLRQLSYPFTQIFFCLAFAGNLKKTANPRRVFLLGFAWGGALLLMGALRDLTALGGPTYSAMLYPSYITAAIINIDGFFQRIEALMAANFMLTVLVKLCVLLLAASAGFAKLIGRQAHRNLLLPLALLALMLGLLLFRSAPELRHVMDAVMTALLPVQTALPLIIWLAAELRTKGGRIKPVLSETEELAQP